MKKSNLILDVVTVGTFKDESLFRVKELTDKDGNVTGEIVTLLVESSSISGGEWLQAKRRIAFVTLDRNIFDHFESKIIAGNVFPIAGKIVVEETFEPYVSSKGKPQEPKVNPKTGEVIMRDGKPIFRNCKFTQNLDAQDVYITANSVVVDDAELVEETFEDVGAEE